MLAKRLITTAKVAYSAALPYFMVSSVALAANVSVAPDNEAAPFTDIGKLVGNVFAVVLVLASVLLFLYLILGGIQWLTSGGDKAATQAARDRITAALTGLLIILSVWGIFKILEAAFGISLLKGINLPVTRQNNAANYSNP